MGTYIHVRRVLQEVTGAATRSYRLLWKVTRFSTGRYNSLKDQENKIQIEWDKFCYLIGFIRSPFQV